MTQQNDNEMKSIEKNAISEAINKAESDIAKGAMEAILMGIAGSSFYVVNPENQLIIRDSDSWNTAWGLITAHYWACYPKSEVNWVVFESYLDALIFNKQKIPTSAREADAIFAAILSSMQLLEAFQSPDYVLTCFILNALKTDNFNRPSILFYLLNKIGVKNIAYDMKTSSVVLLSFEAEKEADGEAKQPLDLEKYPFPFVSKFRIADKLPNPWYNEERAFVKTGNHWSQITGNLHIVMPPKNIDVAIASHNLTTKNTHLSTPSEVLANYTAFTPYFPFGRSYDLDYCDGEAYRGGKAFYSYTSHGDSSPPKSATPNPNALIHEIASLIKDIESHNGASIQALNNLPSYNPIKTHQQASRSTNSNIDLVAGDRGGVDGFASDVQWLHFVPRMISYNWATDNNRRIKAEADLSSYQVILDYFDYTIPEGLNIKLHYADNLPDWTNIQIVHEYTSTMEVVLPEPPKSALQPIALADFAAKRASLPFTCA